MADKFEQLTAFVSVVECRGFSAAACALGISPPAVTRAISALETRLGVRLLQRTTRAVSLTDEGAAFVGQARRILADLRDAEHTISSGRATPRGQLHVTAPVMFGRLHVLPVIADLLVEHPDLTARMLLIDRNVRIVEEGIDVAVRIGRPVDSALHMVTVGHVRQVIVASPAYLAAHGHPKTPDALRLHKSIETSASRVGSEWTVGGMLLSMTPRLVVNTVEAAVAAAKAGLGVANLLSYQVEDALGAGHLIELLEGNPPEPVPICLLFDPGRSAVPGVRAFIDAMRERARTQGFQSGVDRELRSGATSARRRRGRTREAANAASPVRTLST